LLGGCYDAGKRDRLAYWQPHLKLSNFRGDRNAATSLLAQVASRWRRLNGVLTHLELMQYPPVQAIWQAPLKAGAAGPATPDSR
jgi:hypothetical protein